MLNQPAFQPLQPAVSHNLVPLQGYALQPVPGNLRPHHPYSTPAPPPYPSVSPPYPIRISSVHTSLQTHIPHNPHKAHKPHKPQDPHKAHNPHSTSSYRPRPRRGIARGHDNGGEGVVARSSFLPSGCSAFLCSGGWRFG